MITAEVCLEINDHQIAAEIVDSEAVLINLGTGMYYTLDGTGCEVWAMIERRLTLAEMSDALAARYRIERAGVLSDLTRLAEDLLEHGLVRLTSDPRPNRAGDPTTELPSRAETYGPPNLRCYTDMAEILALDPPLPVLKSDA